ncbi:transglycosylase domain-containing protein [Alteribacter aurantiacus]|uniref:transglycosylase domain-containing protein n=1 Tax=Alteribacter aurantiacus TaxID=254410 RepID=UPI00042613ED|nr:PBP1A family penicillin-binding protein [Alteribacter aurantiacus]
MRRKRRMRKKYLMLGVIAVTSMFALGIILYLSILIYGNYTIDNTKLVMNEATVLIDIDGNEITKLFEENRQLVTKDEIPDHVKNAFIAVEDQRFHNHQGIDFRAIGRALYRDILAGSKVEGGSTITQQLAKNTFLDHEKTWLRKTKEVLIAVNLEKRYSKDEILEMYLNRIYFGHGAYGIQAASEMYFNKHVSELTPDEGALLAALPKGPNAYSPINNPERSKQRRDLVLTLMERQGYLTADETVRLQGKTIPTTTHTMTKEPAFASYVDLVLEEAEKRYGLTREEVLRGGYTITVPMDLEMQKISYTQFKDEQSFPQGGPDQEVEGAFVLLNNETGGVVAAQGGREFVSQHLNRVNAKRQPGSTFKVPSVYAPALESGDFTPYSLLENREGISHDGYTVRNSSGHYSESLIMYDAIKTSANVPAVSVLNEIGIPASKTYLDKQQVSLNENGLAIALGGLDEGITPVEMASLYVPFSNGGTYYEPHYIEHIIDREGEELTGTPLYSQEVLSVQNAWHLTRMLEAVVQEGTATAGTFEGALAGKTGTTSYTDVDGGVRDLWFTGYTPEYTGAVWMGYDITDHNHYLTDSSAVPVRLFKSMLSEASQTGLLEAVAFEKPDGVDDLEEPIRFVDIHDLQADIVVSWNGAHVDLNWTGSEDGRLHYRIYEVNGSDLREVGTVVGENEFTVKRVNPFSANEYVVVPYSPQTELEGPPSNNAEVSWSLFSRDAS